MAQIDDVLILSVGLWFGWLKINTVSLAKHVAGYRVTCVSAKTNDCCQLSVLLPQRNDLANG